ncbi:MAG: hypothetical protein FD165_700 [Gammaproteobacteria bacterium]|nr:MAG: hypothetical protein FD165_700 [Gammaproteobacteria bacterium]TND07027.1 MAG: hypothetical protein FD120_195 [Gammaproteobacteria bacterium]
MTKRHVILSGITLGLTLLAIDGLIGVYLRYFYVVPDIREGLKEKMQIIEHPYKSYMNKPGEKFYDGIAMANEYGHLVLPQDQGISRIKKKSGEYRILFLGGSTTFQPWPFYTVELLNKRSTTPERREYKAISASAGGYTSQENVIDLVISGFSYEPDMVVAYLPINDIFWLSFYPDFKRDYSHMRIPYRIKEGSGETKPVYEPVGYPFILELVNRYKYKNALNGYLKKADLSYLTMKQPIPWPEPPTYRGYDIGYAQAVDALIDNIFNMKTLCEARHIKFILITQKLFRYPHGYESRNPFAELIDELTFDAIGKIRSSKRLEGTTIVEMQNKMPNEWGKESIRVAEEYFPDSKFDYTERMGYDDMHFNNAALHLFAALVYQNISGDIENRPTVN